MLPFEFFINLVYVIFEVVSTYMSAANATPTHSRHKSLIAKRLEEKEKAKRFPRN